MTFRITSFDQYKSEYIKSITNPQEFWAGKASNFHWFKKWNQVINCDFHKPHIEWFKDGVSSIVYNALDRHIEAGKGDNIAIIHEPNDPKDESTKITYKELHQQVCQFANLLIAKGIKKGDRVCIYMPMIVEAAVAMLACARIGAVHCVVFAGFSAKALAGRIQDSGAKILITADLLFRGDKKIDLWEIAKEALNDCNSIDQIIIYKRGEKLATAQNVTIWQDEIVNYTSQHKCEEVDAEHPLFTLYTSGSTGKPKGILHTHGGYMVYAAYSFQNVFQYKTGDIFFCTADIGWITGHTYLIYGPLLSGATTVMFEGVPTYPTPERFWQIIEKHKVNIFYTAPTAIRALMQKGDEHVTKYNLKSLKTLGSVGEPINEEAWHWYHEKVGKGVSSIVDTWWQTETGGIMISALSGITPSRASYAGLPLPGIVPILLDDDGKEITLSSKVGNLCFKQPWPGMLRGIWGNEKKFRETYFEHFSGYYFSGDGALKSDDGLYRIIGRIDDVIKVSGHRIGTAEVENAINMHENIAESAVIGYPHEIKGEAICVFAIAKKLSSKVNSLENEIIELIKKEIGAIAKPDKVFIVPDLPKTRSGKIMRRILKKIINGEKDLGDISTLVNPDVVVQIQKMI